MITNLVNPSGHVGDKPQPVTYLAAMSKRTTNRQRDIAATKVVPTTGHEWTRGVEVRTAQPTLGSPQDTGPDLTPVGRRDHA